PGDPYLEDPSINADAERPQWSADSSSLLQKTRAPLLLIALDRSRRSTQLPFAATYSQWSADGSVVYVENNQLWRVALDVTSGAARKPQLVSSDPALWPSVARDGTILYVSTDGLRLLRPNGQVEHLGWPLVYRTASAPPPLFIRNARVIDGRGGPPSVAD